MADKDKYYENLESLKKNMSKFFEIAECDHAQMLGWRAAEEKARNLILKFETFLDEIAYKYVDKDEVEKIREEIQEFLYS